MKLGAVTKLDKRNTTTSKQYGDDVLLVNCDVIVLIFRFLAHLQPSGSRILDAWPIELTFSLTIIFYLTKTENRTKKTHHAAFILLL